MKGVKIINKNGTVNTIDSDFFVNEQKRSVTNPIRVVVIVRWAKYIRQKTPNS